MATKVAIGTKDILAREKEYADTLKGRAYEFRDTVREVKDTLEYAEQQNYLYKEAYNRAYQDAKSLGFELVLTSALQACIDSIEFNWPPYIAHLIGAITSHRDSIVSFVPDESGKLEVSVNMDLLGELDEWGEAVQAARESLEVGLTGDAVKRSQMWAEKIYKTAREGRTLSRPSKKGSKDITAQYSGKYDETINTRLSFLDGNKAPYWYLLEFGNIGQTFTEDTGGTAYPTFGPTNFVSNAQEKIAKGFEEIYNSYRNIVADELFKEYGVGISFDYKTAADEFAKNLKERFPEEEIKKIDTKKSIQKIRHGVIQFEAYKASETSVRQAARSLITGRFVSLRK